MNEQSLGKKPVESRRGAKAFSSLSYVHRGSVGMAVCWQRTTILKWAGRGGIPYTLKELRSTATERRAYTNCVSPTVEQRDPLDGGRARGELLRGIGFDSYDARRAVEACGELLQASTGRFDWARSCVFWCGRSADGIDPPSKVRNPTSRLSRRLKCVFNSC